MAGKSTRITVDLGDESLVKALRIAAVEQGRTVRDIVVEALTMWLSACVEMRDEARRIEGASAAESGNAADSHEPGGSSPGDRDYLRMMENLNRHRGLGSE